MAMRLVCILVTLLYLDDISAEHSTQYQKVILDMHNRLRREQRSSNIQKLEWDETLAEKADSWMQSCRMEHEMGGFGENLGFESVSKKKQGNDYTQYFEAIMQRWYNEIKTYRYPGLCGASCHYTQLIWYDTRKIGCAHRICDNFQAFGQVAKDILYFGCWYSPKGNWEKYPYQKGAACSNCSRHEATCDDGLCSGGQEICKDLDQNCRSFKNTCTTNPNWMNKNCRQTCGCPAGSLEIKSECKDVSPTCQQYPKKACAQGGWMHSNCPKLCDQC